LKGVELVNTLQRISILLGRRTCTASTDVSGDGVSSQIRFPERSFHRHFPLPVNVANRSWTVRSRGRCPAVDCSRTVRGLAVAGTLCPDIAAVIRRTAAGVSFFVQLSSFLRICWAIS